MDYRALYGENADENAARRRYAAVADGFRALKGASAELFYSSPGRAEIVGNHTDHNAGKVVVAAVSCDIVAAVSRRKDGVIEICSRGFRPVRFRVGDLTPRKTETGRSAALARGVAAGAEKAGFSLKGFGGFTAYTESTVFRGAGVSSSAAFEILVAEILDDLHFGGRLTPAEKARIGRFAENAYFGKPCGLLDQSGVAYGGLNKIDFIREDAPLVERLPIPRGYTIVLVNTGGSHASLTAHYAAIRREMSEVAAFFGKKTLRETDEEEFFSSLPALRVKFSDRAILRAVHYFAENARVDRAASALKNGDMSAFADALRESGESSQKYLQNAFVPGSVVQPLSVALMLSDRLLKKSGYRLHGGGFAGTVMAYVCEEEREKYVRETARIFGENNVFEAAVRAAGTTRVDF